MTGRSIVAVFLIFVMSCIGAAMGIGQAHTEEGDIWLRWNDEVRNVYVSAYLIGLQRGFQSGCDAGPGGNTEILLKEGQPIPPDVCLSEAPGYSRESSYYVTEITSFYRDNPQFRYVLIRNLLAYMEDRTAMDALTIRNALETRQPLP